MNGAQFFLLSIITSVVILALYLSPSPQNTVRIEQDIELDKELCITTRVYKDNQSLYLDKLCGTLQQVDSAKCIQYAKAKEFVKLLEGIKDCK